MASSTDILDTMRRVAPPGQPRLDGPTTAELADLTAQLLAVPADRGAELARYNEIRHRTIPLPHERVADVVRDASIVVTGGSGCIGTVLLDQLSRLHPASLTSLAITPPCRPVPGVEYLHLDVCDGADVREFFADRRPDIVFHLAAQRDPGLAERRVAHTVDTNVLGTRQVAEAAEEVGVRRFVYASTGKALRPYTSDVYAASKRVSEWVMADVAGHGRMPCAGVRFTHVVDNSIVLDRMYRWCADHSPVRLHCADTYFYAQSAVESAQLMLTALLAPDDDVFRLHMIRDLGWPVSLLDLALDVIASHGVGTALYLAGHDPGYEEIPYVGLYHPMFAGEVSPLINAMEADRVQECASPAVDAVAVSRVEVSDLDGRLAAMRRCRRWAHEDQVRDAFDDAAWNLLVATVRAASPAVLDRIATFTEPHRPTMSDEHRRIDDVVRRYALRTTVAGVPSAPEVAWQHR